MARKPRIAKIGNYQVDEGKALVRNKADGITSKVKMQAKARDVDGTGRKRFTVFGRSYQQKREAERVVAAGFGNDRRSVGGSLRRRQNPYAKTAF
jgi:hypothetical protein